MRGVLVDPETDDTPVRYLQDLAGAHLESLRVPLEVTAFAALEIGTVLRFRAGKDLERLDPVDFPDDGEKAFHRVEAAIEAEMGDFTGADEFPLDLRIQQVVYRLDIVGKACFG